MPDTTLWAWKGWGWESTPVDGRTVQIHLPPPVPRGSGFPLRLVKGEVVEFLIGHGNGLGETFAKAEFAISQLRKGRLPTRY